MAGWAYLVHSETGGHCTVPDDPSVVAAQEARGWVRHVLPDVLDPDAPNSVGETVPGEVVIPDTERILSEDEAQALKGAALDEALDTAGLSKTGTADEKRARLAEHEAELANTTTTEEEDVNG